MVSGIGRVIWILLVITAELSASYQQNVESAVMIFWLKLLCSFQMPDRCFLWICNTPRYDISMQCYRYYVMSMLDVWYECVMDVLWKCYESVMRVLWMCYGCVMYVLWMRYGCVMDVLRMCEASYVCVRYVMDVWSMLWMCEVCCGCVKDVCVMDEWWIFYIYCVSCIVNGIVIVIL